MYLLVRIRIIRRLEGDLEIARKEADTLRTKLDAREERFRELELKLNRFEVTKELESVESEQSLSDKFDPDAIGRMADKLAPFALVIGDIMKTIKPPVNAQSVETSTMQAHSQHPFKASPGATDDIDFLFPNEDTRQ